MQQKDHDYSLYLAFIALWMMIGGFAQCESESHLDDIRQELREIEHELNLMKYK